MVEVGWKPQCEQGAEARWVHRLPLRLPVSETSLKTGDLVDVSGKFEKSMEVEVHGRDVEVFCYQGSLAQTKYPRLSPAVGEVAMEDLLVGRWVRLRQEIVMNASFPSCRLLRKF
jgi:hypothetical protein